MSDTKERVFDVLTTDKDTKVFYAEHVEVRDGHLMLWLHCGSLAACYAPGAWLSFVDQGPTGTSDRERVETASERIGRMEPEPSA